MRAVAGRPLLIVLCLASIVTACASPAYNPFEPRSSESTASVPASCTASTCVTLRGSLQSVMLPATHNVSRAVVAVAGAGTIALRDSDTASDLSGAVFRIKLTAIKGSASLSFVPGLKLTFAKKAPAGTFHLAALEHGTWTTVGNPGVRKGKTVRFGAAHLSHAIHLKGGKSYELGVYSIPSGSMTFNFTNGTQTFVVPSGVTHIAITALGAQGGAGANDGGAGGKGGSTAATVSVTPGESLTVLVGGAGGTNPLLGAGGFNGGGEGSTDGSAHIAGGGGGGGASTVSAGSTMLVAAGGGGGGGGNSVSGIFSNGGAGGCTTSGTSCNGSLGGGDFPGNPGTGATQSAVGSGGAGGTNAGSGGNGFNSIGGSAGGGAASTNGGGGGGGGGGFFGAGGGGGGGDGSDGGAGGGGSSFAAAGATSVTIAQGVQFGNGQVIITW